MTRRTRWTLVGMIAGGFMVCASTGLAQDGDKNADPDKPKVDLPLGETEDKPKINLPLGEPPPDAADDDGAGLPPGSMPVEEKTRTRSDTFTDEERRIFRELESPPSLIGSGEPGAKPSTETKPTGPGKTTGRDTPVVKPDSRWEKLSKDDPEIEKLTNRIETLEEAKNKREAAPKNLRDLHETKKRKRILDQQIAVLEREITDADRELTQQLAADIEAYRRMKAELDAMRNKDGNLPWGDFTKVNRLTELMKALQEMEESFGGAVSELKVKRARQLEELKKRQEKLRQLIATDDLYPDQVTDAELDEALRSVERAIIERRKSDLEGRRDELAGGDPATPGPVEKKAGRKTGMILADALAEAFRDLDTVGAPPKVPSAEPPVVDLPLGEDPKPKDEKDPEEKRRELEREKLQLEEKIRQKIDEQIAADQKLLEQREQEIREQARKKYPDNERAQKLWLLGKLPAERKRLKDTRPDRVRKANRDEFDRYRKIKKELAALPTPESKPSTSAGD